MKAAEKRVVQRFVNLPSAFDAEIRFWRHPVAGRKGKLSHIGNSSLNGPHDHGPCPYS
jgi:hypothetical protein